MHGSMSILCKTLAVLAACFFLPSLACGWTDVRPLEDKPRYSLSIYSGWMTDNSLDDFIGNPDNVELESSYLLTVALARRIAVYRNLASFEVEGQIVRHFSQQNHWEFNALLVARWEEFFWDRYLDTSFAFGAGPSYATEVPEIERRRSGDSERLQVYLLLELEFALPAQPDIALISRIHHRSNAYGVVADSGTSNSLTLGLKFRF